MTPCQAILPFYWNFVCTRHKWFIFLETVFLLTRDGDAGNGEEEEEEDGAPQPLDDVAVQPVQVTQQRLAQQAPVRQGLHKILRFIALKIQRRLGCPTKFLRARVGCPKKFLRLRVGCPTKFLRARVECPTKFLRARVGCPTKFLRTWVGCPTKFLRAMVQSPMKFPKAWSEIK